MKSLSRTLTAVSVLVGSFIGLCALTPAALALTSEVLDERLDIDLDGARAEDVFSSMAQILGELELEMDAAVRDRRVTIALRQVSIRTMLTAICESIACRWYLEQDGSDRLVVADSGDRAGLDDSLERRLEERIDLELKGARFGDVARSMGSVLEVSVEVDEGVAATLITVSLKQRTPPQILDVLCDLASCRWDFREGPGMEPELSFLPLAEPAGASQ